MTLFTRKTSVLVKIEATPGVDAIPTGAANAMVIRNVTLAPLELDTVDRDLMRPYMGASPQLVVGAQVSLDFEIEIAGAGTSAITKAAYDPLLQACGFASTVNSTTSNDYTPVSSGFKTVTIYTFIDGIRHSLLGAVGNVSFEFTAKSIPVMKFKFMGAYSTPTDSANPTLITTAWQTPLGVNNTNTSGFVLHGYAGILQSLSIDMGNQVAHRNMVGREDFLITNRKTTGSITIQMPATVATKDWFTTSLSMTLSNLQLTHGTVAFNKFRVDATQVQLLKPTYSDQDGIRMLQMGLQFVPTSAGNDEVKFSTL